jgi:hypothetical protein
MRVGTIETEKLSLYSLQVHTSTMTCVFICCYVFYDFGNELQCYHVSYDFESRLPVKVSFGAVTCLMAPDLTSRLRWTLVLLGVL